MPSKSPAQARLMAAAAHDPGFASKVGVPQDVAKDFNQADAGTGIIQKKEGVEEDDTFVPKDLLGVKPYPGGHEVNDVEEDDMDVTSGPTDFLGKPNSMPRRESLTAQITQALTEDMERGLTEGFYLHIVKRDGKYTLIHSSLDDPKNGGGQIILSGDKDRVLAAARHLKKPGEEIKVWESLKEGMTPTTACPNCGSEQGFGETCKECSRSEDVEEDMSGATTSANIATVPMGFKKIPKGTPKDNPETGISLTGAPNRVPESRKRLPHLSAFLEEFSGKPQVGEAMQDFGNKLVNDLHAISMSLEGAHMNVEGWKDHVRSGQFTPSPGFSAKVAALKKATVAVAGAVGTLRQG